MNSLQLQELESTFSETFNIKKTSKGGVINLDKVKLKDNIMTVVMWGCPLYSINEGEFITCLLIRSHSDSPA